MDRAALKQALVDILEKSVGEKYDHLTEDQNLKESLGLDSIDLVSMAIEIQSQFNVNLQPEEVSNIVTVANLLDLLQAKIAAQAKASAA